MSPKKEQGEEIYFLLLALFSIEYLLYNLILGMREDTTQHCRTYIATNTSNWHNLMEVLLLDVCGSGFRPYVIVHCFFSSCFWKKPFSVTVERR